MKIQFETTNAHSDFFNRGLVAMKAEAEIGEQRYRAFIPVSEVMLEDASFMRSITSELANLLFGKVLADNVDESGLLFCLRWGHESTDVACLRCGATFEPLTYLDTRTWRIRKLS